MIGILRIAAFVSSNHLLVPIDRVKEILRQPWELINRGDEFLVVLSSLLVLVVAVVSPFSITRFGKDSAANVFGHIAGFSLGLLFGGLLWWRECLVRTEGDGVDPGGVERWFPEISTTKHQIRDKRI